MYKNIRLIMLGFLIVGSERAYGVDFNRVATITALAALSLQTTAVADTQTTWLDKVAIAAPLIACQLPGRYGKVACFVTSLVVADRGVHLNRHFFKKKCTIDRIFQVGLANSLCLIAFRGMDVALNHLDP